MKNLFSGKALTILIIILAVLICMIAVKSANVQNENASFPRNIISSVVTPIQSGATSFAKGISGFFGHFTDITKLQEENKELNERIDALNTQIRRLEDYKVQNERLKSLLDLKENTEFDSVSAMVVAKDLSFWYNSFTINKGTNDGIEKYNSVITSKGLVGMVTEVGSNWATVTSIIDADSSVGAIIERTQDTAIVNGDVDLGEEGLCKASYISKDSKLIAGDIIVTSGLGGLYPKGLAIGKIRELQPETQGMSQYAVVEPAVDFSKVSEVLVLNRQVIKDE